MRRISITVLALLVICISHNGCENSNDFEFDEIIQTKAAIEQDSLTPIGTIPNWVKEEVPIDVYDKLKTVSSYFMIDYSFLRKRISPKRWQDIKYSMDNICKQIEEGTFCKEELNIFAIASQQTNTDFRAIEVLDMVEGDIKARSETTTVYESQYGPSVKVTCDFFYDEQKKVASNIKCSVHAVSSAPEHHATFQGSANAIYNGQVGAIEGECSGTLTFSIPNQIINENVHANIRIIP